MTCVIDSEFASQFNTEQLFDDIMKLKGTVRRSLDNRQTFDFYVAGKHYFAKLHQGIGIAEFLKSVFNFKKPVVDASTEWRAMQSLQRAGITTLSAVGYGCQGWNPLTRRSFLLTEAVENPVSLETLCRDWRHEPPTLSFKRQLIRRVAHIVKRMHEVGYVHRDCYLCHFLVEGKTLSNNVDDLDIKLIDLHRAVQKKYFRKMGCVKDLAGLYFSSRGCGLSRRDDYRFLKAYFGNLPLRQLFARHHRLLKRMTVKAQTLLWIYQRKHSLQALTMYAGASLINNPDQIKHSSALPAALLMDGHAEPLFVQTILRRASGKRLVLAGTWYGRPVVAKLYFHRFKAKLHWQRECRGAQALHHAGIRTPRLVHAARLFQSHAHVTLFAALKTDAAVTEEMLSPLASCFAEMHHHRVFQQDIHPHNFLHMNGEIYAIDGSDIIQDNHADESKCLDNLCLLFAQFPWLEPEAFWTHYLTYASSRQQLGMYQPVHQKIFLNCLKYQTRLRLKNLMERSERQSKRVCHERHFTQEVFYDATLSSTQWQQVIEGLREARHPAPLIKDGRTVTVYQHVIANQVLVVKRYNIKSIWHALRRCFKSTRARRSWINIELLDFLHIPTAKRVACIEHRFGFIKKQAYLVMQRLSGKTLSQFVEHSQELQDVIEQLRNIFSKLYRCRIVHGDFKASNFIVSDGRVHLIDLDAMRFVDDDKKFEDLFNKDLQRFAQNWPDGHPMLQALDFKK